MKNARPNPLNHAIEANLAALQALLELALTQVRQADGDLQQGHRDAAIGGLLDLDRLLADATALHAAALALHRRR